MTSSSRIQMHKVDGITIVRFNDQQLFDERTVREAADQIANNLPGDGTPIKLIIDFSGVTLLSSSVLSRRCFSVTSSRHTSTDRAFPVSAGAVVSRK